MTDDELDPSGEDDSTDDTVEPTSRTAEEVDQEWRRRVSGKDKAHAAEIAALKVTFASELDAVRSQTAVEKEADAKVTDELTGLKAENESLRQQLDQTVTEGRKGKFPTAFAELGDDLAKGLPDERLDALEKRLATPVAASPAAQERDAMQEFILGNAMPRPFGEPEPAAPQTSAELERELRRQMETSGLPW